MPPLPDDLNLHLDEGEELNALTLTTLLNNGVDEEVLSSLSPAQLMKLEKDVQELKRQKTLIGSRSGTRGSSGALGLVDAAEMMGRSAGVTGDSSLVMTEDVDVDGGADGDEEVEGIPVRTISPAVALGGVPGSGSGSGGKNRKRRAPSSDLHRMTTHGSNHVMQSHGHYAIPPPSSLHLSSHYTGHNFTNHDGNYGLYYEDDVTSAAAAAVAAHYHPFQHLSNHHTGHSHHTLGHNGQHQYHPDGEIDATASLYHPQLAHSHEGHLLLHGQESQLHSSSQQQQLLHHQQHAHQQQQQQQQHLQMSDRHRSMGGQYMNLPASTPQVEFRDGVEWLIFTYSTKGHIQEYHIRADIDTIGPDEIPEEFKAENCVYPRALVPKEVYVGNRWEYETAVNEIAWKLCWRNPAVLCGKRGLIQRAVDSYRNRTPENRSRRVMRQEKLHSNTSYKRLAFDGVAPATTASSAVAAAGGLMLASSSVQSHATSPLPLIRVPGPKTLTLQYSDQQGELSKIKIRVDIEGVDLSQIDDEFRAANAIFPRALLGLLNPNNDHHHNHHSGSGSNGNEGYTTERWAYEAAINELGWKLAWLNSAKLAGKRQLLHKAVEAYQSRVEAAERARQAVLQHHHQALGQAIFDPSLLYSSHPPSSSAPHSSASSASSASASHGHHLHTLPGLPGLEESIIPRSEEFSQMVAHTLQQALASGSNNVKSRQ